MTEALICGVLAFLVVGGILVGLVYWIGGKNWPSQ